MPVHMLVHVRTQSLAFTESHSKFMWTAASQKKKKKVRKKSDYFHMVLTGRLLPEAARVCEFMWSVEVCLCQLSFLPPPWLLQGLSETTFDWVPIGFRVWPNFKRSCLSFWFLPSRCAEELRRTPERSSVRPSTPRSSWVASITGSLSLKVTTELTHSHSRFYCLNALMGL